MKANRCPNCEYERGVPGKPVSDASGHRCLQCGHRWKEFGKHVAPLLSCDNQGSQTLTLPQLERKKEDQPSPKPRNASAFAITLAAVSFLGLVAGATAFIFDSLVETAATPDLQVEQLSFEELVRNQRGKVIRVSGTVSNAGNQTVMMPGVSIILRSAGGKEVARWRYHSSQASLQPGQKTHFRSAKPLNYGIVSSVHAELETR